MPELMTNDQLRQTALAVLEEELGPVEALRFVALIRHEPFDYQAWRERAMADIDVEEIVRRMQQLERPQS